MVQPAVHDTPRQRHVAPAKPGRSWQARQFQGVELPLSLPLICTPRLSLVVPPNTLGCFTGFGSCSGVVRN
ncbi:MAG TPA: hypothetical protein VIL69_04535 [Roseomonas sp.]